MRMAVSEHLRRVILKELPLMTQWLYRLRVHENLDEGLISFTLAFFSQVVGVRIDRSYTIPTTPWQHGYWAILHATSFWLSERNDRGLTLKFAKLMLRFDQLLPCSLCRAHYKPQAEHVSWQLYAGVDPGLVVFDLHNSIAKSLGKPQYTIQQVCDLYGVQVGQRNRDPCFSFQAYVQTLRELERSKQFGLQLAQLDPQKLRS